MELTSKNLYDYLSKHNANQRKTERLLEVFSCSEEDLNKLIDSGHAMGIFVFDEEDSCWKTEDFAKIDSKKFFDFVFAGKVITSSEPAKKKPSPKPAPKPVAKAMPKPAPKPIVKPTLKPEKTTEPAKSVVAEAKPEEPKKEEPIVQKEFWLKGMFRLILKAGEAGITEDVIKQHYKISDADLRFVLDYLQAKGFFRKDTTAHWYANENMSKDPILDKTLIGLRNMAILNNEFKNKAMHR